MDIFHLMDELEDIEREDRFDYPQIYIQIGDIQAPLRSVKYFPESYINNESIILSSNKEPKLVL